MRVLAALCLVVVVTLGQGMLVPGAKKAKNELLYISQVIMAEAVEMIWPNGSLSTELVMGLNMATTDLCKIGVKKQQKQDSIFVGKKCKAEFSELYNENQCSGAICETLTWIANSAQGFTRQIITATNAAEMFDIIESQVFTPVMDWSCSCVTDMMDAWMNCKDGIGEAQIWRLIIMTNQVNTNAEYLQGEDFKTFWENVIINRIPWESVNTIVERMIVNLCQDNEDSEKCYSYFYDTATKMFEWAMNSISKKDAPAKIDGYPGHCSKFEMPDMEGEIAFTAIKDDLVDKFCVKECSNLYQDVLLGCCTAAMIQDEELEEALVVTAEDFAELYVVVFPEEGDIVDSMFSKIFGYCQEVMEMLRNPTCEGDDAVEYDLRSCGEESSGGDDEETCEELASQFIAIEQKMEKKCSSITDPCEGLARNKKAACKRKQNKDGGGNGGGGNGGGGRGGGGGGRGGGGKGGSGGRGGGGKNREEGV